ncbi:MAG: hypothetical protein JWP25_9031 [Bradyrhizobium sp.]|nr:hypothetical protein [Bradyrhizobium sp.]
MAKERDVGERLSLSEIIGRRFGRLVVGQEVESATEPSGRRRRMFSVKCDCGTEFVVSGRGVRSGNTSSCGCLQRELVAARSTVHGSAGRASMTPEYVAWRNMIARCENQELDHYDRYGGRGISVCARWRHGDGGLTGFECFLTDVGQKPSSQHSIDRLDNDRGYSPDNVTWSDKVSQARNRNNTIRVTIEGREMSLLEASRFIGVKYTTAYMRIRAGRSLEDALGIR